MPRLLRSILNIPYRVLGFLVVLFNQCRVNVSKQNPIGRTIQCWDQKRCKVTVGLLLVHVVLLAVASHFYLASLKPCPHHNNNACLDWLFKYKQVYSIAFSLFTSSLIFTYLFYAVFPLRLLPIYFALFPLSFTIVCLFKHGGNKTTWWSHGGVSRILAILFSFIILFSFMLVKIFLSFTRNKLAPKFNLSVTKVRLLILVSTFLICCLFVSHKQSVGQTNYFSSPNSHILFTPSSNHSDCEWSVPNYFMLDILSGFMNLAQFSTCRFSYSLDWVPERLRGASIIGLPVLTRLKSSLLSDLPALWRYSMDNARDCSSSLESCSDLQSLLHIKPTKWRHSKPKFTVRVVRNETMVNERLQILEKLSSSHPLTDSINTNRSQSTSANVLIVYIDALSRAGFKRTMPKTFNLIKRWNEENQFDVHPFFKFSSFAPFTEPNMFPFTFGISRATVEQMRSSKKVEEFRNLSSIYGKAAMRGYVTGFLTSSCQATDVEWQYYLPLEMEQPDHRIMFCDPNFIDKHDPYTPFKGPYSVLKRCMYGDNIHNYAFKYVKSFWSNYPDLPKFFKVQLMEAHESTAEHSKYLDADLEHFLTNFHKKGWLKNTLLTFLSDHGNHMHVILRGLFESSPRAKLELHEPLLMTVTPRGFLNSAQKEAATHNANQLTTMYDIRKTLMSVVGAYNSHNSLLAAQSVPSPSLSTTVPSAAAATTAASSPMKGFDLFNERVDKSRTCQQAEIPHTCCKCKYP